MGGSAAFVVLAALFWGLSGGLGGYLMAEGWDPFVLSFYRGAIGLLFVLAWLVLRPGGSGMTSRWLWFWAVIAGVGVAGNFGFYFLSIDRGTVAVAVTLMYCAPVFVYLVSFALKLETPTTPKWIAIGLVMVGIVLLTQVYDIDASGITAIGVGAGLLAGVSYAIFIFAFKRAAAHGSPQAILTIAFTVLIATLFLPSETDQIRAALTTSDWPLFAALGVLGAGLSFVLYIIGLKRTAPTVASIVAMVEPVTASLFGVAVLNEDLAGPQLLGMGLILVTVTALSVHSSSGQSPAESTTAGSPPETPD
ncbi:MAG: EamA/RhaT family transporter [Gemmatimonadales bacterium]|nr:MAG: EamA/RhaT family transporter [Gemmatimonadales bacterium]